MSDEPGSGGPTRKDGWSVADGPIGRRGLLQGLLGGVGAGIALPLHAGAHPIEHHLASAERMEKAAARARAPHGAPEFLDPYTIETVGSMAERIVPGSKAAGVAAFVDSLLAVDKLEHQRRFLNALGAMEGECRSRFGRPWRSLTEAQQTELLTAVSTAAPAEVNEPWTPGTPVITAEAKEDPVPTLRDHFDHLKKWIAGAFYSSPAGMKELGFTGQQFFASFPGCTHPEGHS